MKADSQDKARKETDRPYQFNLKTLMMLAVVVALPLGIWKFRKTRSRQYASAAQPFDDLGAVVASHPKSFTRFLKLYLFHGGDHLVTSISFMHDPLTDRQLKSLHDELHSLPNLNRILLEDTRITDRGLSVVADLNQLSWIRLDDTAVTDEGVAMIQGMKLMEELGLARTNVTNKGLKSLSQMTQLRTLFLDDTQVTDAGLVHLKGNPRLRMLTLRNTAITDDGLSVIAGMANLRTLDLGNTQVTDKGLKQLVDLKNLKNLSLDGTEVTQEGAKQIQATFPQCRVSSDFYP